MQNAHTQESRPALTLIAAVKICLRKYAEFSGRATRAEFWWWALAVFIVSSVLGVVESAFNTLTGGESYSVLSAIFSLAVLLPNMAVTVRRLHDIGKSGWWLLLWIVAVVAPWLILAGLAVGAVYSTFYAAGLSPGPIEFFSDLLIGFALIWILAILGLILALLISLAIVIWQIIWLARQGQTGPNRYGPDPRAPEETPAAAAGFGSATPILEDSRSC